MLTACGATVAFLQFGLEGSYASVFYRTALMAFVDFGLIYLAIWLVGSFLPAPRYAAGTQTELLLGIAQPWIAALCQVVPIGVVLLLFIALGSYVEFAHSTMLLGIA